MGKKSGSESGIRDRIIFPGTWAKILKFFDADQGWKKIGSGMEKKSEPGSGTNIPDPLHCKEGYGKQVYRN
jgi:hypothetical protein